jgi:hypothetical protein
LRHASFARVSGDCSSTRGWLGQGRDRVPSQICQDCSNNITMFFLPFVQVGLCHLHHPQAALRTRLKMSTEDDVGGWSMTHLSWNVQSLLTMKFVSRRCNNR